MLGLDSDEIVVSRRGGGGTNGASSFGRIGAMASTMITDNVDDDKLNEQKTDAIVWKLLANAEESDDEMWVRVVAGIIREMMFHSSSNKEKETTDGTAIEEETEAQKQLRKITTSILSTIHKSSQKASQTLQEAQHQLLDNEDTDETSTEHQEQLLDSCCIGVDLCPTYVPIRYTLLPSVLVRDILIIPEVGGEEGSSSSTCNNPHFVSNVNAGVLKVDEDVESRRAEEESKEMMVQKQQRTGGAGSGSKGIAGRRGGGVVGRGGGSRNGGVTSSVGNPLGGRAQGAVLAGRMRGRFANVAERGAAGRGSADRGASLFRPNSGRGTVGGRSAGRMAGGGRMIAGRSAGRATGGRLGMAGRGRLGTAGGRSGSLSRLVAGAGRGGRSAPLQRRAPGAARALLSSTGRGGGGAGGGGGGESKMKMIDASEVEGLNRELGERTKLENMSTVEQRKAERKRKLLEKAAESGLRGSANKRSKIETVAQAAQNNNDGDGDDDDEDDDDVGNADGWAPLPAFAPLPRAPPTQQAAPVQELSQQHQQQHQQQQQQIQQQGKAAYESLLQKSNKLSPADRQQIQQFFHNRALSIPLPIPPGGDEATGIWKVKLNEDKTSNPMTGEVTKETLYLELDYRNFGYKKTRKIKQK